MNAVGGKADVVYTYDDTPFALPVILQLFATMDLLLVKVLQKRSEYPVAVTTLPDAVMMVELPELKNPNGKQVLRAISLTDETFPLQFDPDE